MKIKILVLLLVTGLVPTHAAPAASVTVVEAAAVRNDLHAEAKYYYENNWKMLREQAIERGYIASYEIVYLPADAITGFDILLITRYRDRQQFGAAEERFRQLIAASGGLDLLNAHRPDEFRETVFSAEGDGLLVTDGSTPGARRSTEN